jgi:hypothetical protein
MEFGMKYFRIGVVGAFCAFSVAAHAQTFSGNEAKKDTLKWYEAFSLEGYIQTQYHYTTHTDSVSLHSFNGGDFARATNQKFTVRRGRIQVLYKRGLVESSLSFDVNETGFHKKDAFLRITDKWTRGVHLTTGMFARPFGEEIQLSSRDREAPERSMTIQHIFPGIRDLGASVNFQLPEESMFSFIKADAGVFHGTSNLEVDKKFDYHLRFIIDNPLKVKNADGKYSNLKTVNFSVGASYYAGSVRHQYDIDGNLTNYKFIWNLQDTIVNDTKQYFFGPNMDHLELDSILNDTTNPIAPGTYAESVKRTYFGVHAVLNLDLDINGKKIGKTLIRAEYITGTQPSLVGSFGNPYVWHTYSPTGPFTGVTWPKYDSPQPYNPASVSQVLKPSDTFVRTFSGLYIYFTQFIGKTGLQLLYRYDFYDPNNKISGLEVDGNTYDASGNIVGFSGLSVADVAFTTHGFGLKYHFNERLTLMAWFDKVKNEVTRIEPLNSGFINQGKWPHTGYLTDINDDVFTLRLQYIF